MSTEDAPFSDLAGDISLRGGNQNGLKNYNERLIVSLIQEAGELTKAEIARITRLSPQTVTNVANRLIEDGFLRKMDVVRGKVGQPSTPLELDPNGALSIGVKIGRRSLDLLAVSLNRNVVAKRSFRYDALKKETVFSLLPDAFRFLKEDLTDHQIRRLVGVGIAAPTAIEGGEPLIGDPGNASTRWREKDLLAGAEEASGLPCVVLNDATAACLAELDQSRENRRGSMLYFYLSTLIGGGLVIDGQIVSGRTGNAAAVGAIPLGLSSASTGAVPSQLIEAASLSRLEAIALDNCLSMDIFREDGASDGTIDTAALECFDEWSSLAADAIALAAIAGTAFVEAESVVLDGVLLPPLIQRLIERVERQMEGYNIEGIILPKFRLGSVGFDARALGAALVQLNAKFVPDNKVVLKD